MSPEQTEHLQVQNEILQRKRGLANFCADHQISQSKTEFPADNGKWVITVEFKEGEEGV